MLQSDQSFYSRAYSPMLQSLFVLGVSIACMILAKLVESTGLVNVETHFAWLLAATFIMFFAIFNSVFSLSCKDLEIYFRKSLIAFTVLMVVSGLGAWLFSGVSLNEAGTYRWIFIVLGVVYIVFLSMMGFMKRIVEFAQKEEWNHPRIRKKKNGPRKKK